MSGVPEQLSIRAGWKSPICAHPAEAADLKLGYRVLFVAWALLCASSYIRYRILAVDTNENVLVGLLKFLTCYYPWLLLTPLLFRLERRFPLAPPFRSGNAATLALLAFPVCYTTALLALGTIPLLHLLIGYHGGTLFFWRVRITELELQLVLYLMTLSVSAFLRYVAQVRRTEQRAADLALEKSRLESALRQAELETLRMRLNPHFLFNCLQNISALAGQDAAAASTMLARLGDLLRVALRSDYTAEITLDEEVALSRAYVSIEQVRYGSRLSVLFDLEPEAGRVLVPSLLLQPLIENAIKHGLVGRNAGVIWVRADLQNGRLLLTVRDNGIGLDREGASKLAPGVGLSATRARLSRMYGDEQHFSLIGMPEGGTEVKMILPLRRATPASNAHRLSEGWSECSSICLLGERSEISRH